MKKQPTSPTEKRKAGPKFVRSVLPENFQIRRSPSPMAAILDEAEQKFPELMATPVDSTGVAPAPAVIESPAVSLVEATPVDSTGVAQMQARMPEEPTTAREPEAPPEPVLPQPTEPSLPAPPPPEAELLPALEIFLDEILPHFPPAQQAILLRLYRWSGGYAQSLTVSTPRLAASVKLDEKAVRGHLQTLIKQGLIVRETDGELTARFGGTDRSTRGLLLRLDAAALAKLRS